MDLVRGSLLIAMTVEPVPKMVGDGGDHLGDFPGCPMIRPAGMGMGRGAPDAQAHGIQEILEHRFGQAIPKLAEKAVPALNVLPNGCADFVLVQRARVLLECGKSFLESTVSCSEGPQDLVPIAQVLVDGGVQEIALHRQMLHDHWYEGTRFGRGQILMVGGE